MKFIFYLSFLLFLVVSIWTSCNTNNSNPSELNKTFEEKLVQEIKEIPPLPIFPTCVSKPETAKKIAEAVWIDIYGDQILQMKPYVAALKDSVWYVKGTLKNGFKGGEPYIQINCMDGKILKVTHTK